jgi:hypothetical protein
MFIRKEFVAATPRGDKAFAKSLLAARWGDVDRLTPLEFVRCLAGEARQAGDLRRYFRLKRAAKQLGRWGWRALCRG